MNIYIMLLVVAISTALAPTSLAASAASEVQISHIININNASATTLTKLKGVGAKTAAKIIKYRTDNGPFKNIEDLTKVKGVGKSVLSKNKQRLSI